MNDNELKIFNLAKNDNLKPFYKLSKKKLYVYNLFKNSNKYERPDFFSVLNKSVYIFEHFSFTATKKTKKGDSYEIGNKCLERELDKAKSGTVLSKQHYYSNEFYLDNFRQSFFKHYKKLNSYRENIIKSYPKLANYSFHYGFIFEDSYIFGSYRLMGGNLLPCFATKCNEIRNILKEYEIEYAISTVDTQLYNQRLTCQNEVRICCDLYIKGEKPSNIFSLSENEIVVIGVEMGFTL